MFAPDRLSFDLKTISFDQVSSPPARMCGQIPDEAAIGDDEFHKGVQCKDPSFSIYMAGTAVSHLVKNLGGSRYWISQNVSKLPFPF